MPTTELQKKKNREYARQRRLAHPLSMEQRKTIYDRRRQKRAENLEFYREQDREKSKRWRLAHPDRMRQSGRESMRKWRTNPENAEAGRERVREWRKLNQDKQNAKRRKRFAEDPVYAKKIIDYQKKYRRSEYGRRVMSLRHKKRMAEDIQYRLRKMLRNRLRNALLAKGIKKSESAIALVGCSIPYLKIHFERQFSKGMSWENYGPKKDQWESDHIIELARFDLRDPEQQKLAFHFTNLRPMWSGPNRSKGAKRLYLICAKCLRLRQLPSYKRLRSKCICGSQRWNRPSLVLK